MTVEDIRHQKKRLAGFSSGVAAQAASLKRFLNMHFIRILALSKTASVRSRRLTRYFNFSWNIPIVCPALLRTRQARIAGMNRAIVSSATISPG